MKITTEQLMAAFGRLKLSHQWFPLHKLVSREEMWPATCGSMDLREIVKAVNVIPIVALAPEPETCEAVAVRSDGAIDAIGAIPMPVSMKIREIARSMWGGDPDDDMSHTALGVGAMEELMSWLEKQGRLK